MQQRYYDPGIGLFLSVDPVTAHSDPIGQFHRYRYANNNPYTFTDPDGRFFQIAGGLGGGAVGLIATAVGDVASGELSSPGTYIGSIAGGFVAGMTLASTGNPILAGAAGGAFGNATQQAVDNGGRVDPIQVAAAGAVGAAIGNVVPGVKVPGITSGKNSYAAIAKSMATKLAKGNISNVSSKTTAKAAIASGVEGSAGAATGETVTRGLDALGNSIQGALNSGGAIPASPSMPRCTSSPCAGN